MRRGSSGTRRQCTVPSGHRRPVRIRLNWERPLSRRPHAAHGAGHTWIRVHTRSRCFFPYLLCVACVFRLRRSCSTRPASICRDLDWPPSTLSAARPLHSRRRASSDTRTSRARIRTLAVFRALSSVIDQSLVRVALVCLLVGGGSVWAGRLLSSDVH